jgi:putative transcriptional regulator
LAALLLLTLATAPGAGEDEGADFLVGRLLVATPALKDSFFDRTVIYLVEHNEDGAFGLIVNRTLGDVGVKPLFERLGLDTSDAEGRVRAHESTTLFAGLAMTTDPAILKRIGRGEGPGGYLFAFGYSGWAPGQLESEIEEGSWIDVPAEDAFLFGEDDEAKWQTAVDRYSVDL